MCRLRRESVCASDSRASGFSVSDPVKVFWRKTYILIANDTGSARTRLWVMKKEALLPTQAGSTVSTGRLSGGISE